MGPYSSSEQKGSAKMFFLLSASCHCLTPAKLQRSAFGMKSTGCMQGQLHFSLLIQQCTRGTLTPTKETVQRATRQTLNRNLPWVLNQTLDTKDKGMDGKFKKWALPLESTATYVPVRASCLGFDNLEQIYSL